MRDNTVREFFGDNAWYQNGSIFLNLDLGLGITAVRQMPLAHLGDLEYTAAEASLLEDCAKNWLIYADHDGEGKEIEWPLWIQWHSESQRAYVWARKDVPPSSPPMLGLSLNRYLIDKLADLQRVID